MRASELDINLERMETGVQKIEAKGGGNGRSYKTSISILWAVNTGILLIC